jgi:hypothetical protein
MQRDQLVRVGEWERLEKECIRHAEDGGVGADPQSEGKDHEQGKARAARQAPQGRSKLGQ